MGKAVVTQARSRLSLSMVLPLYNESEILERNLVLIDAFLAHHFEDYEIIIVESGSTDGSGKQCDLLAAQMPNVRVFHEGGRNGIGSATRIGIGLANKDLVWRNAIDLPSPLPAILDALPLFDKYDCVISYRSSDDRTSFRKVQSLVYNQIAKMLLGVNVRHVNAAFKVFRRRVIQQMPLSSNLSSIDAEMIYWIGKQGLSWVEIPVPITERTGGKSTVPMSEPFRVLGDLLRLRLTGRITRSKPS